MDSILARICLFLLSAVLVSGKIFEKCELAHLLETTHGMPRHKVKNWVCIAQYESTFNTEAINKHNWDGSWDHGLFQISNKYWCDDDYGKNVCKMKCSDLLDDDLKDDLKCIKKIIRSTERWKGKGTALTAWVAYVKRCQNRNLDVYMSECWDSETGSDGLVVDNFIPRVPDVVSTTQSSAPTSTTLKPDVTSTSSKPDASKTDSKKGETGSGTGTETGDPSPENVPDFIPSARVPLPPTHYVLTRSPGALTYKSVSTPVGVDTPRQKTVWKTTNRFMPIYPIGYQFYSSKPAKIVHQGKQPGISLTFYN